MSHKDPMIEFLAQPDNMRFLLEIEPLIKKTMNYKYEKCFKIFLKEYLSPKTPKILPGYSEKFSDNTLIFISETFKEEKLNYFNIHVHLGQRDKNNWYGIYGNEDRLYNQTKSEFQKLKDLLKKHGVNRKDKWVPAFQFFPRNREELLTLPDEAIDDILKEWSNIFWDFANNIKSAIEAANEVIRSQNMT